ncbi:MAG: MerR family transcriptional regulator [Gemmatimonadetes bacterium]|nr:MerR family transcriptional regulator [Gemmatimonadota bacterium]
MNALTSGEVARRAGIGVEALRFYEREGLIPAPPRGENGYRRFPVETVRRIHFIQRAQDLGFTLREIEEPLELRVKEPDRCAAVEARAATKLRDVRRRIQDLRRMESVLRRLVRACRTGSPTRDCPILATLEDEDRAQEPEGICERKEQ